MYWILRHKLWDHFKTHRCRDRGPSHEGGNDFHGNSWSCFWSQKGQWILGIWSNLPVVCPENGMIPRCSSNQWPWIFSHFFVHDIAGKNSIRCSFFRENTLASFLSFGCSSTILNPAGWLKHVQIQANRADEASSLRSSSKCLTCWRLLFLAKTPCDKTAMLRLVSTTALRFWLSQDKAHLIISQIFPILCVCFSDWRREINSPRINYCNMAVVVDEDPHPHSSHSSTELVSGDLKKLTASMFLF